jgi:hypothetical protein
MTDKKVKIEFDPHCFDDFEGTQEELDEIIDEIHQMFADGLEESSVQEVDIEELFETDPEVAEKIFTALRKLDDNSERILQ